MPSTWTCGCGQRADAPTCPECGWAPGVGQPDATGRRWLPRLAGVATAVLVAAGVTVAVGADEPAPGRTGPLVVAADELDGAPGRALPIDLGTRCPPTWPAGSAWTTTRSPGSSARRPWCPSPATTRR